MTEVRRATAADLPAACEILADAFGDYPWMRWTLPAAGRRERLVELFGLFGEYALHAGEVWVTDRCESVAMWLPANPARPPPGLAERMAQRLPVLQDGRRERARGAEAAVEALRPSAPAWYLATMATAPGLQGRGLGSAVLAPFLARCDREGLAAATDTSTTDNVRFYRRHGFSVHAELDLPGGGPHVWLLWRSPVAT